MGRQRDTCGRSGMKQQRCWIGWMGERVSAECACEWIFLDVCVGGRYYLCYLCCVKRLESHSARWHFSSESAAVRKPMALPTSKIVTGSLWGATTTVNVSSINLQINQDKVKSNPQKPCYQGSKKVDILNGKCRTAPDRPSCTMQPTSRRGKYPQPPVSPARVSRTVCEK